MNKKILFGFIITLFSWHVSAQVPANDLCADAISIACGDIVSGNTSEATETDQPAVCGPTQDNGTAPGVWYNFTGTGDLITLSLCGGNTTFDTQIQVFSGDCNSLVCVDGNDQGSCGNPSEISFVSDDSTNYLIYIYGWVDNAGAYELEVTCSPPPPPVTNDTCDVALPIACGDSILGTTLGATSSDVPPTCGGVFDFNDTPGVWYSIAGTGDLITLSTCTTDFDTQIQVFSGNCFGLACIGGNNDNTASCGFNGGSQLSFISDASTNYLVYINATGFGSLTGIFTLDVTCSPPPPPVTNDTCDVALPIACGDSILATTLGATSSDVPPTCGGVFDFNDTPGVWYSIAGTGDIVTLSTCTTDFDTQIQVFSGNCFSLVCLGGNNDNIDSCGFGGGSEFSFESDASTNYLVYVNGTGFGAPTGIFTLDVTCIPPPPPPANDNCDMATVALVNADDSCTILNTGLTLTGATDSNVVNDCIGTSDNDVWFEFTATNDIHIIELQNVVGNETDLVHAVYEGADCNNLTQISCSDPDETTLQGLTIGDTYYLRVWTFASNPLTLVDFDICIRSFFPPPPPSNDECDAAIVATVNEDDTCAILNAGTLTGATDSQFASGCPGSGDDDVWFQFVATSEAHQISLFNIVGDVDDLVHGVYTGPDCNNLTEILCSDTEISNSSDFVVGQTYYIRVYSFTADAFQNVDFNLCINEFNTIVVNSINDPETALSAEELVEQVFVEQGGCGTVDITFTNLIQNPQGELNPLVRSWGYFRKGDSDFPLDDGIILSSGFAESAEAPNDSQGISDADANWGGDIDIQTVLDNQYGTVVETQNATAFEFEFTSNLPLITFDFIFASEEYEDQFECSDVFRDGFAFLIKGPGIPDDSGTPFGGSNIASIQGTNNFPVSTETIRRETMPGDFELPNCDGQIPGVDYFPDLYVSNDAGNINAVPIQFDGLTTTLTTASINVQPGEVYTVKLVIADRGDSSFDSIVFLKGGSFDLGDVQLGEDITIASGDAACDGEEIIIDAGTYNNAEYEWSVDGTVISGETGSTLTVSGTGNYSVIVSFTTNICELEDEIFIEFFTNPEVDLGDDVLICSGNTATLDGTPTNAADLGAIAYQWSVDGTEIAGETNATLVVSADGIYTVEVTGDGGCVGTDEVLVNAINFNLDLGTDFEECGVDSFEIVPVINGEDATNATYSWSTGDTSSSLVVTESGVYTLEVTIGGCLESDTIEVILKNNPVVTIGDEGEDVILKCADDIVTLTTNITEVDSSQATYVWSTGETTASIDVTEEGIYTVDVTVDGCSSSADIEVEFYGNEGCIVTQGISPNGDNLNDNLDLQYLAEGVGINKLSIFNRYGRIVYELDNYINEWVGQDNDGNELPVSTYYYVIDLVGEDPLTGFIYINREQE